MGLTSALTWPAVLDALAAGDDLDLESARESMGSIMRGEATDAQIGAFLLGMRIKGETETEMAGMASAMREASTRVELDGPLLDTCGTGGDRLGTINVSTCAAFVAAGAGARVAKHGNRAASSQCGSADLLEAMGVKIDLGPDGVRRCIEEAGVGFMFARTYHPAMRHVAGPRSELGVPTVMNVLGPLSNPARADRYALGVARADLAERMIGVLKLLGAERALVLYGHDGLDELSISGPSTVFELRNGEVTSREVYPEKLGIEHSPIDQIRGGDVDENLRINNEILEGKSGATRDVVVLNAAAGIVAFGLADDLGSAVELAKQSIDSGAAGEAAAKLVEVSNEAGGE